jgi:hypothetical protein
MRKFLVAYKYSTYVGVKTIEVTLDFGMKANSDTFISLISSLLNTNGKEYVTAIISWSLIED